jgi:hypothetical protein
MMSRMLASLAATAVAVLHLAFIAFVLAGGIAVLRWPRLAWIHLPAAVWGALIEFAGWYCPLTTLENRLLRAAGRAGYEGGFVAHYIFAILYPAGLTRGFEIALGTLVVLINIGIYVKVFH